jgi:hypothetical protein
MYRRVLAGCIGMAELFKEFFTSNIGQSLAIAALIAIATQLLTARGRLAWAVTHQHFYQMPNPAGGASIPVRTQEIWIQNVGRASIENVEITLNYKPQHFEVWSPRKFTEETIANNRLILTFPSLAGREFFRISLIEMRGVDLPLLLSVKWKDGEGRRVNMGPLRIFPKAVNLGFGVLGLVGATTILYGLLQLALRIYDLGP